MANKNLSQFDTTTTTQNVDKKFLVGYDSTTAPSKEVKIPLSSFVTSDVNGNISHPDGLKVQKLNVSANGFIGAGLEVVGEINVTPTGLAKRVKPAGWGGGLTTWDVYADGGTIAVGNAGSLAAFMTKNGYGYFSNNLDVDGTLNCRNKEVRIFSGNDGGVGGQLRLVAGETGKRYGIIHRNDGHNYYVLQTKPNDPEGGWSDQDLGGGPLRNFAINLTGPRDTWMNAPLNVYNAIGANLVKIRRQNTTGEGGELSFCRSSDDAVYWINDVTGTSADPNIRWWNRGVSRLTLDANGNLTASGDVAAFSDAKLKTNVKTIEGALGKVNALRGVEFEKISTGEKCVGVIAQEVETVIPQVVGETEGNKTVAYGNLVGVLIEAIKELTAEVEALKAQINK